MSSYDGPEAIFEDVYMKILTALLLSLPFCSFAFAQEALPTEQIMSQEDRQNMGLDRMSPQEKRAFEEWVARYTHHVLEQSPSYRPGQNLSLWVQSWPSYSNPTKTNLSPEETELRQQANQLVDRIRNNGEYVDLKDGSSWHISPFFRYLTTQWQKNQTVEIRRGRNSMHPWLVNNVSLGQVAEADLTSQASNTGKKEPESPEYYHGAVAVGSVTQQGDLLTLGDGSVWKVAPTDMYKVRNWAPGDRVRVEKSDNFLYTYHLTNLDNGEVSLANPRK